MANFIAVDSNNTFVLGTSDHLYVPKDVSITTATTSGVSATSGQATGTNVVVDGTILSFTNDAIWLGSSGGSGNHDVLIGAGGVVRSLGEYTSGVDLWGSSNFLQNFGEISGGRGVFFTSAETGTIQNFGSMVGTKSGITLAYSSGVKLMNDGIVTGTTGIDVYLASGVISNSGEIHGTGYASSELTSAAIDADYATDSMIVSNSGLINSAAGVAVHLNYFDDLVRNSGKIVGDVFLDGGADVYRGGKGEVEGTVFGGDENDVLLGGVFEDVFEGGAGNDTLRGRGGDDEISGGAGNDKVFGGAGEDTLSGDDGADNLYGRSGDDRLLGGGGNDYLLGNSGDDSLIGGAGSDTLSGGRGSDWHQGGGGADKFVFFRKSGDDVISDFQNGVDEISLWSFGLHPNDFNSVVKPALSNAGGGMTLLDLEALGGEGSVLIRGLSIGQADVSDFVL